MEHPSKSLNQDIILEHVVSQELITGVSVEIVE